MGIPPKPTLALLLGYLFFQKFLVLRGAQAAHHKTTMASIDELCGTL